MHDLLPQNKTSLISVLEELFRPQTFHQREEMNHSTLRKFSAQASRCWAASSLVTDTGGKWAFSHAADMSRHVNTTLHAHVGEARMMQTASLGKRAVSHGGPLNSVWTHSLSTAVQSKWLSSVLGLGKIEIYFRYCSLEFYCSEHSWNTVLCFWACLRSCTVFEVKYKY